MEEALPSHRLSVYRQRSDGTWELAATSVSHSTEPGAVEVLFNSDARVAHLIRLGTDGNEDGGQFILHWSEAEPPVWLRYIGRVRNEVQDAEGDLFDIGRLGSLTLGSSGDPPLRWIVSWVARFFPRSVHGGVGTCTGSGIRSGGHLSNLGRATQPSPCY